MAPRIVTLRELIIAMLIVAVAIGVNWALGGTDMGTVLDRAFGVALGSLALFFISNKAPRP